MKGRKPRQPWISQGTWCTVKVIAPLRRLANQAAECGRFARMECCFAAWVATRPCEFAPGDHQQGPYSGWKASRTAARSFNLASALWAQADPTQTNDETRPHRRQAGILGVERQGGAALGEQWRLPRHVLHCLSAGRENFQNGVAMTICKQKKTAP